MRKHIIILPDGREIGSGAGARDVIQSVTLTESVNAGDEPTLGSACASLLEMKLLTPDGGVALSAGDEITLYADVDGRRTQLGIFILEKPTRPSGGTLKLTGYDRIIKLDKDLTAWLAALEFPMDMQTFAQLVCRECGLELATAHIPNGDMTVQKFTCDGVTGRQLMQWVGEASVSFVRASADGRIQVAAYTRKDITVGPTGEPYYFAGGLSYEDYEVEPVDAVQLRLGSGEDGYLWPAEAENGYIITGNPLLQVTEEMTARLQNLIGRIPRGYRPCKVSMPTSVDLQAGDVFTVRDKNGVEFTAGVMTKITQGQKMTIECVGSRRRSSAAAMNSKTAAQQAAENKLYAQSAAQSAAQQAVQNQTQQDIFDKLTNYGQVQGIYVKDGKLYINAEFVKILNLITDHLVSTKDKTRIEIEGAKLVLETGSEKFGEGWGHASLSVSDTGYVRLYLNDGSYYSEMLPLWARFEYGPDASDRYGRADIGIDMITKQGYILTQVINDKVVSWKDNGDGTYTLIGT